MLESILEEDKEEGEEWGVHSQPSQLANQKRVPQKKNKKKGVHCS